jgi:hypothetical protein
LRFRARHITMLALWKALPQGMVAQKPNVKAELKVLTRTPVVLHYSLPYSVQVQCLRSTPILRQV